MNERDFEIIFTRNIESIMGFGWHVLAQQLTLPIGRIDVLLSDHKGRRHLIELKKGSPNNQCIDQVLGYAREFKELSKVDVQCWIVANAISQSLMDAAGVKAVKTLAISEMEILKYAATSNLSDFNHQRRKLSGVMFGGEGKNGLWSRVDDSIAYGQLRDNPVRLMYDAIKESAFTEIASGKMQTVIKYRGFKIGGINRRNRHFYISNGVILSESTVSELIRFGGWRDEGPQRHKEHKHVFYMFAYDNPEGFLNAFRHCAHVVDRVLGPASR